MGKTRDYTLILASGVGQRLRPLTDKVHKALVPINGVPNLCRTVKFANEAGITHHFIITLESEKQNFEKTFSEFDNVTVLSLKDEFIRGKNNSVSLEQLISFSKILQLIDEDSKVFIIDSDTYFTRNIFKDDYADTQYITQYRENEWVLIPDSKKQNVCRVEKSSIGYAMSGVSVWKVKQLKQLYKDLQTRRSDDLYYDDVIIEDEELLTSMKYIEREPFMFEYDSVSDLLSQNLMTPEEIARFLSDDNKAISLKSMTNSSFLINYHGIETVCRIEGKGVEFLDREQERLITDYASYILQISPKSLFVNDIKFTKYIKDTATLTKAHILSKSGIYLKFFDTLSVLHDAFIPNGLKPINLISEIREYEKIASSSNFTVWNDEETSFFTRMIKENEDDSPSVVHRDLVTANILIDRSLDCIKLIDWEYSGVLSVYWDIGCFASEVELEFGIPRTDIFNDFLCYYSSCRVKKLSVQKMNLWSCIVDFVWSKWAEAKVSKGEDYKDYAKLRHDIAIKNMKGEL